jgi:2'-hydroxyisoflavone reductase
MKLLVLGGPRFLGRHLVAAAQAAGHRLTMFNRGRTDPDAFPEVEKIRGDRAGDLSALDGRTWDAVVDTSGYLPDVVRRGVERLRARVGHYHFVSSISVHSDFSAPGMTEDAPVATLTAEQRERVASIDSSEPMQSPAFLELYGPLKAECEQVVREVFGDRAVISRPGLIIGPHDYMDRFPYWVARIAEGGEVLAPGRPERPVQVIDARDLAEWIVRGAESGLSGTFTATGPDQPLTMGGLLDACRTAAASDARFTWVDEEFLLERAVGPWEEMPMWLPERTSTTHVGILRMDVRRAVASGLRFRPLLDTARDVLAWERMRGEHPWRAGLAREKERALLEGWWAAAASRSAPAR